MKRDSATREPQPRVETGPPDSRRLQTRQEES
jgi:hypothetical protein